MFSPGSRLSYWVSKIKDSSSNGRWHEVLSLYSHMNKAGVQLTEPSLFHPILKACSTLSLKHGKSLHASVVKLGLESCTSMGNSIMDFYVKAGQMCSTVRVFGSMKATDSISWNILIFGHLDHGDFDKGLWSFAQARQTGFEPNISTLVLVIQTIRNLRPLHEGQEMHVYILKTGFLSILSIQNSLLCMYADMEMESARKLFDEMSERDVITWNVMISGYVKSDEARVALGIFRETVSQFRSEVDGQTMVSALKACTDLKDLVTGRLFHGFLVCKGFGYDLFVGNSVVDMYSKCSDSDSALQAWREMPVKNIISWNSLLSGYVYNDNHSEALRLFDSMQKVGMEPNAVTLVNLLQVCKHYADPLLCKCIHTVILRKDYTLNELVVNTLIDVYAKCNLIFLALKLFNGIKNRDTVSWSTMIAAFTYCGLPDEAIRVFQEMIQAKEKSNAITIFNLIEACSYDAQLERLKSAHGIAIRRGFASEAIVGTAILDMYSRYGDIVTSKKAFEQISVKNTISFTAMIAAYGVNGLAHDALSLLAEMKAHGVKTNSVTALSVLAACSHGGLVEQGLSFFQQLVKSQEVELSSEHYSCLVDLLSRAGKLELAMEVTEKMLEGGAGARAWGALLSGCRRYDGNEEIGGRAASRVIEMEPDVFAGYMLASGMYAVGGSWEEAAKMRGLVRERQVKVVGGYSMVHVNGKACRFVAGDRSRVLSDEIWLTVDELHDCMKDKRIDMDPVLFSAQQKNNQSASRQYTIT